MDKKEELLLISGKISWLITELEDLEKVSDIDTKDVIRKIKTSLSMALAYSIKYTGA